MDEQPYTEEEYIDIDQYHESLYKGPELVDVLARWPELEVEQAETLLAKYERQISDAMGAAAWQAITCAAAAEWGQELPTPSHEDDPEAAYARAREKLLADYRCPACARPLSYHGDCFWCQDEDDADARRAVVEKGVSALLAGNPAIQAVAAEAYARDLDVARVREALGEALLAGIWQATQDDGVADDVNADLADRFRKELGR